MEAGLFPPRASHLSPREATLYTWLQIGIVTAVQNFRHYSNRAERSAPQFVVYKPEVKCGELGAPWSLPAIPVR